MPEEVPKEVLLKGAVEVNVHGGCGETFKDIFPAGRYPIMEGLAVHKNGKQTNIFLIAAKQYNSWLPVWEWQLLEKQGAVKLIF